MFIVIDIDFPEHPNKTWVTKQEARDYIKCYAELCGRTVAGFRIYDTERHVTIKLVRKAKTVFEAYVYNTDFGSYRGQLFTTLEKAKRWCESQGANPDWWRVSAAVYGKANQRISPKSFGIKPKELR